jgi:hypothetical protein
MPPTKSRKRRERDVSDYNKTKSPGDFKGGRFFIMFTIWHLLESVLNDGLTQNERKWGVPRKANYMIDQITSPKITPKDREDTIYYFDEIRKIRNEYICHNNGSPRNIEWDELEESKQKSIFAEFWTYEKELSKTLRKYGITWYNGKLTAMLFSMILYLLFLLLFFLFLYS